MASDGSFPASEEHRFFQAVEESFVRLRGTATYLSAADWQLVHEWHRKGIPLELILGALEDVFERRRLRGSPEKIQGLKYCKNAVETAWAEVESLSAPQGRGRAESFCCDQRLQRLAESLPPTIGGAELWRRRILDLQGQDQSLGPRGVERRLFELDRELIEKLEAGLSSSEKDRLVAQVEKALAPLREQGGADLDLARRRLLVQKVRREFSVPMLSLFSPEAAEDF